MKTLRILPILLIIFAASSAFATFMVDPNPNGVKLYNDLANKNVSQFSGYVGGNSNAFPLVTIDAVGNVDTGSGFSNIKPIKNGSLTMLTFTPADPLAFSSFSFRGQLNSGANGTVDVTVVDAGGTSFMFSFTGLGNGNFGRIGVISLDGETIKSVTLTSDFKEQKQNEFGLADPSTVPEGGATVMLIGLGLVGIVLLRRFVPA